MGNAIFPFVSTIRVRAMDTQEKTLEGANDGGWNVGCVR